LKLGEVGLIHNELNMRLENLATLTTSQFMIIPNLSNLSLVDHRKIDPIESWFWPLKSWLGEV